MDDNNESDEDDDKSSDVDEGLITEEVSRTLITLLLYTLLGWSTSFFYDDNQ